MIQTRSRPPVSVIFFELNEAERHFLDKFVAAGLLPNFERALSTGAIVRTRVPGWDASEDKAWRKISPWIVWPSVYTGLTPAEHGIVGFGQDPAALRGRCVWDVLDAHGISTGILGSLMSYPPRTSGAAAFYVPESLADTPECFPEAARPLQDFCVFAARNYSESFGRSAATAVRLLLRTGRSGVRAGTILRTLGQVPAEALRGASAAPERAMLHSYMTRDAFHALYRGSRPAYASVHMNHVAYVQHRYWRAAEPERFEDELSATDRRFFQSVSQRKDYERRLAHWIERAFRYSDRFLGELFELAAPDTVILVGTALGQRPFDPVRDIHNPVVRLVNERELFDAAGLVDYVVLHQMNPDVTVNLRGEAEARAAERVLAGLEVEGRGGLFTVQRRGSQVFLELDMPRRERAGETFTLRHRDRPDFRADFARHIHEHESADQSTAHHKDSGWLLACRPSGRVRAEREVVSVTDVAPAILALHGLPPAPWMRAESPAFLRLEG
ncbi:MAG: alkaline phosphatase family protein [Planctomycetes bacterium]|nr:alkaline phosphatase family protein [Planctomycetota bacterium]